MLLVSLMVLTSRDGVDEVGEALSFSWYIFMPLFKGISECWGRNQERFIQEGLRKVYGPLSGETGVKVGTSSERGGDSRLAYRMDDNSERRLHTFCNSVSGTAAHVESRSP